MSEHPIDIVVRETGAKVVKRNLEDIGESAARAASPVDQLKRLLAQIGVGFTLHQVISVMADFSQEMATLRAVTGATGEEFEALRGEARRLGAETRFSATEAAQAATELARAGFTSGQVLQSLNATLTLAQAGGVGLGQAAEIAGTALRGFRLEASQAQRVVDILAEASNKSNAGVVDLGEAMSYVAPVAAGVGVSIEEATAAIAALSNAGLKGSTAGTGLRRVISELESPSTKAVQILRTLGLEADDVRVSQVGLTAALETLARAGIDTGLALEFFGDRGGPAFEVLQSNVPMVREFNEQLKNATGSAQRVANVMNDNLKGALQSVRAGFEAVIIAAGDLGAEALLTKGARALATALRFISTHMEEVVQGLAILSGTWFVAFGGMTRAVALLRAGVVTLTAAIAANPIGLLVVGVSAAIAAVTVFGDQIAVSADGVVSLKDVMVATFGFGKDLILDAASAMADGFGAALAFVQANFGDVVHAMGVFIGIHKTVINAAIGFWVGLGNVVSIFSSRFTAVFSSAVDYVVGALKSAFEAVRDFVVRMFQGIADLTKAALELIGVAAEDVAERVRQAAEIGGLVLQYKAAFIPPDVKQLGSEVAAAFMEGFKQDFVGDAIGAVGDLVTGAGDAIMERARARAEERKRLEAAASGGLPDAGGAIGAAPPGEPGGVSVQFRQSEVAVRALREEILSTAAASKTLEDAQRTLAEAVALGAASAEEAAMIGRVMAAQLNDELNPTQELNRELDRQAELLKMSSRERGVASQAYEYEQSLIEKGVLLTDAERAALQRKLETLQTLGEEAELRDRLEGQVRTAKDMFGDLAQSSRSLLVGAIADPLGEGLDDLPKRFRGIMHQMAAELAVSGFFKLIAGLFGGGGGFFASLFSSLGGGGKGFATGGSFMVPGTGGVDSRLVNFRATPGERVTVQTPEQQRKSDERGGGGAGGDTFVFPWSMPAEVRSVVENVAAQVAAGTAVKTVQRMNR